MKDALILMFFAALTFLLLSLGAKTRTVEQARLQSIATNNDTQLGLRSMNNRGKSSSSPSWSYAQPIFNPAKLESDNNYRRVVWNYWLNRNLDGSRGQAPELNTLISLCTSNGLPTDTCSELVRRLYVDISEIQRFESFAREADEVKEKQIRKVLSDSSSTEEQHSKVILHLEDVAQKEKQAWSNYATLLRQISLQRAMRESGLKNIEFFDEVFSIRFSQLATGVETDMAENETVFD